MNPSVAKFIDFSGSAKVETNEYAAVDISGKTVKVPVGAKVGDVLPAEVDGYPVIAAILNNMVVSLETPFFCDASARPLTILSHMGSAVYRDTFCFLLAKAAASLFPGREFRVHSSIGSALWCTLEPGGENLEKEYTSTFYH